MTRPLAVLAAAALLAGAAGRAARAQPALNVYAPNAAERAFADTLARRTFDWFWETTPPNGLTPDRWPTRTFSSVAAVGFALTAYPVGAERGWVTRAAARGRALATLRTLWRLPQGPGARGVAGYRGFFYHFLDFDTGLRYQQVELSTIDTALLMAGVLACRAYFDRAGPEEREVRCAGRGSGAGGCGGGVEGGALGEAPQYAECGRCHPERGERSCVQYEEP